MTKLCYPLLGQVLLLISSAERPHVDLVSRQALLLHHDKVGGPDDPRFASLSIGHDGVLVPALVPHPGEVFKFKNKEKVRLMELLAGDLNEYNWVLDADNEHQNMNLKIASVKGSWKSNTFGHACVKVRDASDKEVFAICRSKNVWNPLQFRDSFRVLPPGGTGDPLFTVNKDVMGRGMLWVKQAWTVYKGRKRENTPVMFCEGNYIGWKFKMYKSAADRDSEATPIAEIKQSVNLGAVLSSEFIPDKFKIEVHEGADTALVLALSTIIDMVHDSNEAAD